MSESTEKPKSTPQKESSDNKLVIIFIIALLLIGAFAFGYLSKKKDTGESKGASTERLEGDILDTGESTKKEEEEVLGEADEESDPIVVVTDEEILPDLYVHEYSFSDDPETGVAFTVHIEIKNQGDADAEDVEWEWWSSSGNKACDGEVDDITVGEKATVECDYTYGSWSTYATKVVVDSEDKIEESDETNNEVTKDVVPIHEEPKADLYISEYSFIEDTTTASTSPEQWVPFRTRIGIYNQGDVASGDFWWEWWATSNAPTYACRERVTSIAAHGGKIVYCPYTYEGWTGFPGYSSTAKADVDDEVDESDETNNEHMEPVMVIHP
ncbi:CARDB domain-containing protein [Patescibacteria group bacterium]